ncbi:uncharacterized [Tachysurus ichikawai]
MCQISVERLNALLEVSRDHYKGCGCCGAVDFIELCNERKLRRGTEEPGSHGASPSPQAGLEPDRLQCLCNN